MSHTDDKRRILILGGGFAGVYTAMNLERKMSVKERQTIEIVLVSNDNYLVFQPLLPEVISGTIETLHCISPIRRLTRHAKIYTRAIEGIDLDAQTVRLAPGYRPKPITLRYDHLVVCLGTRLNYSLVPGMREHASPFKYLGDALRLRNELVHALEEADIESDPDEKKKLLTFVVAGGGFSGVECMAETYEFLMRSLKCYHHISPQEIRCILLQSAERILPELSEPLARYAQTLLQKRGIDIRLNTRMKAVSENAVLAQVKGQAEIEEIPSRTVVTTVPAAADPIIAELPLAQERGRLIVSEFLNVDGQTNVWSLGDCAAVPQKDGITSPPTAQHAIRQAKTCAVNILAEIRGQKQKPFLFTGLGKLASLGRGSAVAEVMGIKLRGVLAWVAWRTIYLSKIPGFDRKFRIGFDWLLDLILPRDITQLKIFPPDPVRQQHYHAGETIFDEGDFGDQLYVIVEGVVEVVQQGSPIAQLRAGDVFGEIALVSDLPRTAAVIAHTDVDLIAVSRDAFQHLVKHLPGVRPAIHNVMRQHGVDLPEPIEDAAEVSRSAT